MSSTNRDHVSAWDTLLKVSSRQRLLVKATGSFYESSCGSTALQLNWKRTNSLEKWQQFETMHCSSMMAKSVVLSWSMPYAFAEPKLRAARKLCRPIQAPEHVPGALNPPDAFDSTTLKDLEEVMLSTFFEKDVSKEEPAGVL